MKPKEIIKIPPADGDVQPLSKTKFEDPRAPQKRQRDRKPPQGFMYK